jgi:transcription elongation factor GreA
VTAKKDAVAAVFFYG